MSMIKEFKDFAMRGNVVDMAVGVIIGGAFGKITSSLVNDVFMPPLGMLLGKMDFKDLKLAIAHNEAGEVTAAISYGLFINTIIDFILVAFCLFLVIKAMNKLKKKEEAKPAAPPADVVLLTEIRDLLKK